MRDGSFNGNSLYLHLQLLLFLKGFSESERNKLAMLTGILLANGTLNASILNSLYNENLVKEGKCWPAPPLGKDGGGQNRD